MSKPKKHHVNFKAEKKVPVPVDVDFQRKDGTEVAFPAHKKVTKKVEVDFMAKNKGKK
jgi:hypothetical protein